MFDLRLGDCLEVMADIPDGSVDMVLADPPYGTTAARWDTVIDLPAMWAHLKRIVKPNGAIVLFGAEPFSSMLRTTNPRQFKYDWIWEKQQGTGHLNSKRQPLRKHEVISVFYKKQCTYNPQMSGTDERVVRRSGKASNAEVYGSFINVAQSKYTGRYPTTLIKHSTPKEGLHPTQKPVALMEYLIRTYTNEGETVLDFTMGSGTCGVACANTGRQFIGIELDPGYFEIARTRIEQAHQAKAEQEAA